MLRLASMKTLKLLGGLGASALTTPNGFSYPVRSVGGSHFTQPAHTANMKINAAANAAKAHHEMLLAVITNLPWKRCRFQKVLMGI